MADAEERFTEDAPHEERAETIGQTAGRKFGYICAIVANLAVLWVFRNLPNWDVRFITAEWLDVLPALEHSIYGTIAAHLLYIFYDARWFRRLGQIGMNVLSFLAVRRLYRVFPFDFEIGGVELGLRIGLIAATLGLVIASVVEIARLVLDRD